MEEEEEVSNEDDEEYDEDDDDEDSSGNNKEPTDERYSCAEMEESLIEDKLKKRMRWRNRAEATHSIGARYARSMRFQL